MCECRCPRRLQSCSSTVCRTQEKTPSWLACQRAATLSGSRAPVLWCEGQTALSHIFSLPFTLKVCGCNYFALSAPRKNSNRSGVLYRRIHTSYIKCCIFHCINVKLENISNKTLQRSSFISVLESLLSNYLRFIQRGCVSQCGLQIAAWNFAVSQLPDVQSMLGEKPERKRCLPVQNCRTTNDSTSEPVWETEPAKRPSEPCKGPLLFRYFSLSCNILI